MRLRCYLSKEDRAFLERRFGTLARRPSLKVSLSDGGRVAYLSLKGWLLVRYEFRSRSGWGITFDAGYSPRDPYEIIDLLPRPCESDVIDAEYEYF